MSLLAPASVQASARDGTDAIFSPLISASSPGCAVAASKEGRKVVERAYGIADLEHGIPITPATIFEAGSASKQVTAAAILLLAQAGKLALNDDIRKHLPEMPDYGAKITVDQLLHHTSGLRDWRAIRAVGGNMLGSHVHSNADAFQTALRQRGLNHQPGAEYAYTNTGYSLAAIIVERVSGQSLAVYSRQRIFEPLGMRSTQWRDDFRRVVKNRAIAYGGSPRSGFTWEMPFENAYGAGGLLTTARDLLIWNRALEEGRLGIQISAQLEEQGRLNSGERISYARGLFIEKYRGTTEVSHGGATLGYVAFVARFPQYRVSVAVLCNASFLNPNELAHRVADQLLPAHLPAPHPRLVEVERTAPVGAKRERWQPTISELEQLVGSYESDEAQATCVVQVIDGRLVLRLDGRSSERRVLSPTYLNTFVFVGGSVEFQRDERGMVSGMNLAVERIRKLPFARKLLGAEAKASPLGIQRPALVPVQ
jgi:CubicO group peptidase (beta-lactamase class C family)